jgi:hypothetical protein
MPNILRVALTDEQRLHVLLARRDLTSTRGSASSVSASFCGCGDGRQTTGPLSLPLRLP